MDIYGKIETVVSAVGTGVITCSGMFPEDKQFLIKGIAGAVVTCTVAICNTIRTYKEKNAKIDS